MTAAARRSASPRSRTPSDPPAQSRQRASSEARIGSRPNPVWQQLATRPSLPFLQTKLIVGAADDPYEKEADRVAEQVMRMPAPETGGGPVVQRTCAGCDEEVRRQPIEEEELDEGEEAGSEAEGDEAQGLEGEEGEEVEEEEAVYAKKISSSTPSLSPATAASIDRLGGQGEPLPATARAYFEPRFGHDFSSVRIHTGQEAAQTARALGARAYTLGHDVVFGSQEFAPDTSGGRSLLAHELTHVVQQEGTPSPPIRRFRVRRAASVPSLKIREWTTVRVPDQWAGVRRRLSQRDTRIAGMLALVSPGTPEEGILIRMRSRWGTLRRLASSSRFNPATGGLPSAGDLATAQTDELADIRALRGRRFRFVKGSAREFLAALNSYLRERTRLDQEQTEYHRFDAEFAQPDVVTLLSAIPHARFTTADLKALVDQETGDLTNTRVAGITGKGRGITSSRRNRGGYVGLGQHSRGSRSEAITWASAHGVTIPRSPDPRRDPAQSIRLAAAYLGRCMDLLWPVLPRVKPAGDELKKMVFASYNKGFDRVRDAANSFLGGTPGPYTWNDIKFQPRIVGEMRSYVAGIVNRLS